MNKASLYFGSIMMGAVAIILLFLLPDASKGVSLSDVAQGVSPFVAGGWLLTIMAASQNKS